jgi:hypothetical protein
MGLIRQVRQARQVRHVLEYFVNGGTLDWVVCTYSMTEFLCRYG